MGVDRRRAQSELGGRFGEIGIDPAKAAAGCAFANPRLINDQDLFASPREVPGNGSTDDSGPDDNDGMVHAGSFLRKAGLRPWEIQLPPRLRPLFFTA
jgi:hypothetical protein